MRQVDTVLLDFGGVFTASPFEALRLVGEARGLDPARVMAVVFGSYDDDTDHPWHRAERGELALDLARAEITALGRAEGFEIDLFDVLGSMAGEGGGVRADVVDRTRALRQAGLRVGLVTNNVIELRELWRALLPVDELFDVVVDSSEVGVRKPDARIFHLALDQLGEIDPARAVFADDHPGNVVAARRLGLHGVVVAPEHGPALVELAALAGLPDP